METIEYIFVMVVMLLIPVGFFLGRYKDPFFKTRINRQFLKKETILLSLMSKDRKTAKYFPIDPYAGAFVHKGMIWFADNLNITRAVVDESKVEKVDLKKAENVSFSKDGKLVIQESKGKRVLPWNALTIEIEKGVIIKEKNLRWHEGVPILFVDEEHLTPIEFEGTQESVKPIDLFANLTTYEEIQADKNSASKKKDLNLFLIIAMIAAVGALALSFLALDVGNQNLEHTTALEAKIDGAIQTGQIQAQPDKIVIDGG